MLTTGVLWQNLLLCLGTVPFRFVFTLLASGMSDQASKNVKRTLRSNIYDKLTRLGPNYTETAATSEVVMLASEGVEQIDTYFAKYLPQLGYSLLAPVTLFVLLVGVHARSATSCCAVCRSSPCPSWRCRNLPKSCWQNTGASIPPWATAFWKTSRA